MAFVPPSPTTPAARRRRGVGPFSLRQVTVAIGLVMVTAIAITLASVPLASINPGLPVPLPSAYILRAPVPGLRVGDLAPDFDVPAADGSQVRLTDLSGKPIRLADLRGRVVWVNFWASWCPPCQYETPILRSMDEKYRARGLSLIGIQVQQTVDDARAYADRYGLGYTIGADVTGDVFREYKVFALPTQFFIDQNGVLRQIVNGPLEDAQASAILDALLPPAPSESGAVPSSRAAGSPAPSAAPRSPAP